jgi:hypothetical protein
MKNEIHISKHHDSVFIVIRNPETGTITSKELNREERLKIIKTLIFEV